MDFSKYIEYRDGKLFWVYVNPRNHHCKVGDEVGSVYPNGYRYFKILGQRFITHRVIFFLHNGYWPEYVDHIDGNKQNNYPENLRDATGSQNSMNRSKTSGTTSSYKGVYWNVRNQKWIFEVRLDGKRVGYGECDSEVSAAKAYNAIASEYFGEFAKLNVILEG